MALISACQNGIYLTFKTLINFLKANLYRYNPDFGKYGFAQLPGNASTSWPGILANNPYTGAVEPYTGRLNISDFIADLMVPQMELLAYKYESEIMWCDCGVSNFLRFFNAHLFL